MGADADAAFRDLDAEDKAEQEAAPLSIDRVEKDGTVKPFLILSEQEFYELFEWALNGPQALNPAFRHIAIDNGQPYRPEGARATADRIYSFCLKSGVRFFENLLAVDQSGMETVINLALIGWFGIGTAQGAAMAMAEMRGQGQEAEPEADAEPVPVARAGMYTSELKGGAA